MQRARSHPQWRRAPLLALSTGVARRAGAIVQASLVLYPHTRVADAHKLAIDLREVILRAVPDVHDVDLHIELFDGSAQCPSTIGTLGAREELPTAFRLNPRLL